MAVRAVIVFLFAVLTTIHVVRNSVVAAWLKPRPAIAIVLWSEHPDVQRSIAMAEVGAAAALGREPSVATVGRLKRIAAAAPLAPEPLLVEAAIAQRNGDYGRAEQMLVQARNQNPRSTAARFLLAHLYFRSGRLDAGLAELAVFSRFVPGAIEQLAPALAEYAKIAGPQPQLKRILAIYPDFEPSLLTQLATDTRNIDLILALASPRDAADQPAAWEQMLINKLVDEKKYELAYSLWARLSRVPVTRGRGLFNPRFAPINAPPPFNWILVSGSDGVAGQSGQGLQILYFGRRDLTLASQLMLLPPGRYRIEMEVTGKGAGTDSIVWTVTCLPREQQALRLPIGRGPNSRQVTGEFQVPSEACSAQRLELKASAGDLAESAELHLTGLRLARSRT